MYHLKPEQNQSWISIESKPNNIKAVFFFTKMKRLFEYDCTSQNRQITEVAPQSSVLEYNNITLTQKRHAQIGFS
jgi:hypothetical protein